MLKILPTLRSTKLFLKDFDAYGKVAIKTIDEVGDPRLLESLGGGDKGDANPLATDLLPGDKIFVCYLC